MAPHDELEPGRFRAVADRLPTGLPVAGDDAVSAGEAQTPIASFEYRLILPGRHLERASGSIWQVPWRAQDRSIARRSVDVGRLGRTRHAPPLWHPDCRIADRALAPRTDPTVAGGDGG